MSRPKLRRGAAALLLAGGLTVAAGLTGMAAAGADTTPGSGFGSLDLAATAASVRAPFYSSSGEDVEGQIPWSTATLQSGGVGHALSSVFWPGDTGGHGGDTLALLAPSCLPTNPQGVIPVDVPCAVPVPAAPSGTYDQLNDPYKAETQTGGKPASVSNPGVSLTATATEANVVASAVLAGSTVPAVGDTFGASSTKTVTKLVGASTAVVDATSAVKDISLGGGAIHIASIVSTAHAVTNGKTASGTATTVVHGMTIGGVPVAVDGKGVHLAGQSQSLAGTDQLNTALAQTGFKLYVAKPTITVKGATAAADSGNLILMQGNDQYTHNANDTGRMLILGGATAGASGGPSFPFVPLPPLPVAAVPPAATTTTSGTAPVGGSAPAALGAPAAPGAAPQVSTPVAGVAPPLLAAVGRHLPGGLPTAYVLFTVIGTGLLAFGLRRLPDRVLATTTTCSLGDS